MGESLVFKAQISVVFKPPNLWYYGNLGNRYRYMLDSIPESGLKCQTWPSISGEAIFNYYHTETSEVEATIFHLKRRKEGEQSAFSFVGFSE